MIENKMSQIASLFEKRLEEKFSMRLLNGKVHTVKFTEHGLLYFDSSFHEWRKNYMHLSSLCEGKSVIIDDKKGE